ncbi:hypothetical protein MRS44_009358 [Fusarium solani]|uniref:uncharacterized protein n=1 Tax=Fusarium solani TaxID=169388 RepID=UPI0032C41F56|nr:hypothetical protein MRS44_009358 [Fusarium solani]
MTTTSPEETPKSSAQSFRRLIQELQDENGLVVIKSEVDLHLELAAIVRNVYETEDKAPLFNNVKDRQENGLFRILGAPVGASKIPGKRVTRIAKSLGLPSHVSDQEIIHKIHETKRLPKVPPKEADFIGALPGSPVEVTKCEMNDILVPTEAEIVFEGVVSNTETASEGPIAEYHGHIFRGESKQCTIFKVNSITNELRAMKTTMEEFCNKVGHVVLALKPGFYIPTLYLVGDDIDPTNFKEVVWAAAMRCQPRANEFVFDEYPNVPLIPYVGYGVKSGRNAWKMVRCCLFPS